MADSKQDKVYSWVDWDGRTHVNVDVLLDDPKVKETIKRLGKANEKFRNQPGITFLRPLKSQG
jgi:hypothetical protein